MTNIVIETKKFKEGTKEPEIFNLNNKEVIEFPLTNTKRPKFDFPNVEVKKVVVKKEDCVEDD